MHRPSFWLGYLLGLVLTLSLSGGLFYYKFLYQPAIRLANMSLVDLQDRPVDPAQWAQQPLVVNYWATWCGPCVEEFPLFEQVKQRASTPVVFLMVSDESPATIQAFVRKHPYHFTFLRVRHALPGVNVRPVTYVYSKDQKLLTTHVGSMTTERLQALLVGL
ncbi:MAG: TlpA family protein disulfide reductase [Hymenobacter sp.]|nr:MAG: TlpA family protein disulfide reductase [Hymenobacter sp.]